MIAIWIIELTPLFQHAHALELLSDHLTEGKRALDVGSGSGYLTACMALLVITLHCRLMQCIVKS